jgi:hypothetical protein
MDVIEIKNQMTELQKKIDETRKHTTEQRLDSIEKELNAMKDRYINLLESTLEAKGNRKLEISNRISKGSPNVQLDKFQLLLLLQQSKATTPEFAVSSTQLQRAFSLGKTTRTIRDKLTSLELMHLVASLGQKPKIYYLTARGVQMISQQQKGLMQIR